MSARAWIHGGDQHEAGRETKRNLRSSDGHVAVFQALPELAGRIGRPRMTCPGGDAMMAPVRRRWMREAGKLAQRAIACNGRRHPWHLWHPRQCRICKLQSHLDTPGFKSHLRHQYIL